MTDDHDTPHTFSVQDSAREYVKTDENVRRLEDELKAAKKERDQMRSQLIDEMIQAEAPSVEVFDGQGERTRVYPINRLFARRDKEVDEDEFFDALRAEGYEHLIKNQVNANSLSALVRELAEDAGVRDESSTVIAQHIPEDLRKVLKIDTQLTLGIRRS